MIKVEWLNVNVNAPSEKMRKDQWEDHTKEFLKWFGVNSFSYVYCYDISPN